MKQKIVSKANLREMLFFCLFGGDQREMKLRGMSSSELLRLVWLNSSNAIQQGIRRLVRSMSGSSLKDFNFFLGKELCFRLSGHATDL